MNPPKVQSFKDMVKNAKRWSKSNLPLLSSWLQYVLKNRTKGQCMKCDLLHLIYYEMGCGILNFSVLDFLFCQFWGLAVLNFLQPFKKGNILQSDFEHLPEKMKLFAFDSIFSGSSKMDLSSRFCKVGQKYLIYFWQKNGRLFVCCNDFSDLAYFFKTLF